MVKKSSRVKTRFQGQKGVRGSKTQNGRHGSKTKNGRVKKVAGQKKGYQISCRVKKDEGALFFDPRVEKKKGKR